ncbi:MAG: hypothetical protein RIA69_07660 [Cyclobacteriaceae bacterium]
MSDFEVEQYFALDSLLVSQGELLAKMQVEVQKSVKMDEQFEEITFLPDSTRFTKEFQMIKDFSLNKNSYIGAFDIEKDGASLVYSRKKDQPVPIKRFTVKYNEEIALVSGQYFEDKDIFQHERNFRLLFDESGVLSEYKVWGFQKMILQDTIQYDIVGKVVLPSN